MVDDQTQRELEFKLIGLDSLERFSDTFEACFGVVAGKRYFEWKYKQNPVGTMVGFEALHRGKPIASYGMIPELYSIAGKDVRVYQSMDTMTHPAYQRRGLFGKLAELTYAHVLEKEGRLDMIGVPGAMSHGGFVKKLNWRDLKHVRTFFAPRAVHAAIRRLRRPRSLTFRYVSELTPELAHHLEHRPPSARPIANALHPAFFDWRVFQNPTRRLRVVQMHEGRDLVGVCVFSTDLNRRVFIALSEFKQGVDIAACSAALLDELFQTMKAPMLLSWEPTNERLRSAYAACGFLVNPWRRGPMSGRQPLIVRSEHSLVNGVDWYRGDNFDLQPIMQD
jgi:hypothetical protein